MSALHQELALFTHPLTTLALLIPHYTHDHEFDDENNSKNGACLPN